MVVLLKLRIWLMLLLSRRRAIWAAANVDVGCVGMRVLLLLLLLLQLRLMRLLRFKVAETNQFVGHVGKGQYDRGIARIVVAGILLLSVLNCAAALVGVRDNNEGILLISASLLVVATTARSSGTSSKRGHLVALFFFGCCLALFGCSESVQQRLLVECCNLEATCSELCSKQPPAWNWPT